MRIFAWLGKPDPLVERHSAAHIGHRMGQEMLLGVLERKEQPMPERQWASRKDCWTLPNHSPQNCGRCLGMWHLMVCWSWTRPGCFFSNQVHPLPTEPGTRQSYSDLHSNASARRNSSCRLGNPSLAELQAYHSWLYPSR